MALLQVENLTYRYPEGEGGISQISFTLPPKGRLVVLGANGSGKSTLLRTIAGLYPPTAGRVVVEGIEVGGKRWKEYRSKVGILFQNPASMIFNPSVYEEIAFGLKQKGIKGEELKRRVEEMAERVGVAHLLNRNPIELSGGEQQRVVLGAILITEPALLLLDEPTSALDPRTTGWLMQFLEGLEVGVIVATHDLMTAYQLGDEVLVLNGGRLEFYGEMEELFSDLELLERCNLIYRYRRRCFCDSSYIKLIKEAKNGKRGY